MCAPYVEARPKGGARAEKEIGEKAQKIIRYQIVSTYFLHGAFKVLFFGLKTCLQPSSWFDNVYLRTTTEHPEDLFTLYVMRVQKRSGRTFGVFRGAQMSIKNS